MSKTNELEQEILQSIAEIIQAEEAKAEAKPQEVMQQLRDELAKCKESKAG